MKPEEDPGQRNHKHPKVNESQNGIGHIYIGKVAKGITLLIHGIIIQWLLGIAFFMATFFGMTFGPYGMMHGPGVIGLMLFASVI